MKWDEFLSLWAENVGTTIPEEACYSWFEFAEKAADSVCLQKAVERIGEVYLPAKMENNFTPAPVLKQLKNEYFKLIAENKEATKHIGCQFCEGVGVVAVVDSGDYKSDNFPPDPAEKKGCICNVPCPVCRGGEYFNSGLRERVYNRCRPNSRIHELR